MNPSNDLHVEELWWEEDTLCIKTTEGQVWKFTGAHVTNVDYHFEDDENVTVTRVPLVFEKVKSCLK